MAEYEKQVFYDFSIVIIGIILIVISYSELTEEDGPKVEYIYPENFFADTYDYPFRDQAGVVWHPKYHDDGELSWVRSRGGKIRIAQDGRIIPTTPLSKEDMQKTCVECHEDKI